jgi:NAD(P)-dependent dehydrogenase (short-subunit alcohol dehydrogenase family)
MSTPVVLITCALTGIGQEAAFAFAQQGDRIVVSGRPDDAGETLVRELCTLGTEAEFIRADIRHEDDVRDLVDRTVGRFGRLDACRSAAWESPMRSPTPSFSLPPTRRPLLPATCFPSMAGSRQGSPQTRQ